MNKPNQNKKGGGKGGSKGPQTSLIQQAKTSVAAGLSPKGQKRYIHSQAQLQYGPQARQIRAEQRASKLQAYRDKVYFKQYGKSLKPLKQQTAKAYNQAATGIASDNAALGDYAARLQAQLNTEGQTSANLRGVGYTPDATGSQAAIARYATGNTLGGVVRAQGASQRAYLTDQKRIGKREAIDVAQQEANRGRSYNQDLQNLQREKGAAAAQAKQQLLDSNRQFYLGLRSSQTTRQGQKIAAKTSRQNTATTQAGENARASLAAQTSRANTRATQRGENRRTRATQRGENRRSRATQRGENRRAQQANSGSAVDKTHVYHMVKVLDQQNAKDQKKALSNPSLTKAKLAGLSTTYTRAEVNRAYAQWRKRQGGGGRNVSQATGGHRPS